MRGLEHYQHLGGLVADDARVTSTREDLQGQ